MFNRRPPRRQVVSRVDQPNRLKTSWFQPSNESIAEQEQILANMFFLVKQGDSFGERLKCVECGGRHKYITLRCVNKPITGLANGLFAYYRVIKDFHLETELSPAELSRFQEINQVLMNMPDIGSVHPQLARTVTKDIGPSDLQLGAVSLGILEPISPTEANSLAQKINDRGIKPKFVLVPPKRNEIDRALSYRGTPKFTRSRW